MRGVFGGFIAKQAARAPASSLQPLVRRIVDEPLPVEILDQGKVGRRILESFASLMVLSDVLQQFHPALASVGLLKLTGAEAALGPRRWSLVPEMSQTVG